MDKTILKIENYNNLENILGNHDKNLQLISDFYNTKIVVNNDEIIIYSMDNQVLDKIFKVFDVLKYISESKLSIQERDVIYVLKSLDYLSVDDLIDFYDNRKELIKTQAGKSIYPKTLSQVRYIQELSKNEITISYGPAGTGKTYIAVCDAIKNLKKSNYKKIVLTRPVVEAGESLGFLPGEIKEKVDPYLIPLYDAIYDLIGKQSTLELIENGTIEIAPLAYMRGRTLENSYVILDEAQNTTNKQMKLFLTRLGFNSKMVITGDISQIDLNNKKDSGLISAINKLNGIKGIKIVEFSNKDIVRNPLIQKILERYEND